MARVAQLAAHLICNQGVFGSTPNVSLGFGTVHGARRDKHPVHPVQVSEPFERVAELVDAAPGRQGGRQR